jgi:outer membrane protein assembly factor BamB
LLLSVVCARAEIIIVDDSGPADFNNVQAAINDCNHGDTIIVLPGTYSGEGNHDIGFLGKAVTVRSVAPDDPYIVAATVIDCNGYEHGFYFHSAEGLDTVLDGLTVEKALWGIECGQSSPLIRNCIIKDSYGCGVLLSETGAVISDCTITGTGSPGGDGGSGIAYAGGVTSPTVTGCTITNNHGWLGAGIRCGELMGQAPLKIQHCTIAGNTAMIYGGGVCAVNAVIRDCAIWGNFVLDGRGGGICGVYDDDLGHGGPSVSNCQITDNFATSDGGGLFYCPDVMNCVITGNTAGDDGGGLAFCTRVRSCIISGNEAGHNGGGIYYTEHLTTVANCTVIDNRAGNRGGGIYAIQAGPIVDSSIFRANADSTGGGDGAQICGGSPYISFSCIQDDDPNDSNVPFGGEDMNNIDDNPMFVREPNDGGDGWGDDPCTAGVNEGDNDDFGDLHLRAGSPCINAGDPCFAWWIIEEDVDGEPRLMGGRVDMGADEFLVPWVTVSRPEGGEVWVAASTHEIEWEGYDAGGTVDISYSINNGADWIEVENDVANTGSYLWHLPEEVDSNESLVSVVPSVPDANVVCTESGLFTIRPYAPGPPAGSRWKSLGGDFGRSGLSESSGPELGCVKWQFETGDTTASSVTVGPEDRIHIACEDGKLYTLDANGVLLWSYDTNSPFLSAPTIGADGTLYVGNEDKKLYAVDVNGHVRWTHTTDGFVYSSPAVSPDGNTVYFGSQDGLLYALGRDSSELWTFETQGSGVVGGSILASPAVGADGTVYIGGFTDSNLYAIEPNDGSLKWSCSFDAGGALFASPVVGTDGTIYQTLLYDPNLYAIEPNGGSVVWSLKVGIEMHLPPPPVAGDLDSWTQPVLGPDGTIYAVFTGPCAPTDIWWDNEWVPWLCLAAIDPNGSMKWSRGLGASGSYTLTVGSKGVVYAAGSDGYLCAIDANGGDVARYQNDSWLSSPVVSSDAVLIVVDGNDRVSAIATDGCEGEALALRRPEDLDGSGRVDFRDFALLAVDWLACTNADAMSWEPYCDYDGPEIHLTTDIDRDLYVNWLDLRALANRWLGGD